MTAQTIPFPRARKRGAKVRIGPMARIYKLPTSLVNRWIAYMLIGARPEEKPGDNERYYRSIFDVLSERSTPEEIRANLDAQIQRRREVLKRELTALQSV